MSVMTTGIGAYSIKLGNTEKEKFKQVRRQCSPVKNPPVPESSQVIFWKVR
jgi:hypothetical protein